MANPPSDDTVNAEKDLEGLKDPVTIVVHEHNEKNEMLEEFKPLLDDIASRYDKITVKYVQEEGDPDDKVYHLVDHFPALVILDKDGEDHGIRFYGCPSGGLFNNLISTILLISTAEHGLDEETIKEIEVLEDTDIQVLVTPNAPSILDTIETTQRISFVNSKVKTCVLDLIQFPDIAEQYRVLGIPKTIINETQHYTGPFNMKEGLDIIKNKISDAEG
jgi:alkyl hydroperoxide reductase subunit AhpF